jgi:hypothetical protein
MRNIIIYLSVLVAAALYQPAAAQDIQLNILTLPPGTVELGDTTYIQVDICNVDANPVTAPAFKIRTLISTSPVVTVIKATTDTLGTPMPSSQWLQLSLGAGPGNSIRLEYQHPLANFDCQNFYIQIVAGAVGTGNFTGTLQWGSGVSGGASGPQTVGNDPANDNSTTGIVVTTPLPVSLTDFTAVKQGNTSLLNWNTATEVNNSGFDIERSADGRSFSKIGIVYSKADGGNSNEKLAYSYVDAAPLSGTNYYRLRQVDRDGKSVYSKIRQVTFDAASGVKVYPNPATHTVYIEASEGSQVSVYNIIGQRMEVRTTGSGHLTTLDVSALSAGNYTIHILDAASGMSSHKLTVVK